MTDRTGGYGLDPETLAAYAEGRLSPDEAAAVERRLAADPDAHALLVQMMKVMDALPAEPVRVAASVAPSPPRWWRAGAGLAAAAVLTIVVGRAVLPRWFGPVDPVDAKLARLVDAVGENRYVEPRLTGGFRFGPLRPVTREAPTDLARENLEVFAAAAALREAAERDPSVENLIAWGVAQVLTREYDGAVETLQRAAVNDATGVAHANLAAAYLARGQSRGQPEDVQSALDAADTALRLAPSLVEARFNRALAREKLGTPEEAVDVWQEVLAVEPAGPWAEEARARRSRLR